MTAPLTTKAILDRYFARAQPGPKRRRAKAYRVRCPLCRLLVDARHGVVLAHEANRFYVVTRSRCLGSGTKAP